MLRTSLGLKHIENIEDLREELGYITKAGFDTVDLDLSMPGQLEMLHSPEMPRMAKEARGILDEFGMKVFQGHSPFGLNKWNDSEYDRRQIEEIENSLTAASILGIENMIIHPFFCFEVEDPMFLNWPAILEKNITLFTGFVTRAGELGIRICTENMFGMNRARTETVRAYFSSAENLSALMDAVPGLCCCMDTGHALVTGFDLAEMARTLGKRLTTLHIHTNNGQYDLHLAPFQNYPTDWTGLCKALKELDYQGSVNLEVGSFTAVCPAEMKLPSYQYLHASALTLAKMIDNA